jgi:tetratricopeptide (TPR) repeat protein
MIEGAALAAFLLLAQQPDLESGLRKAVSRSPSSFQANHRLGEYLIQQNKLAEAIPYLERAQRADPRDRVNSYDLGLAYLRTGQTEKALRHVNHSLNAGETADLRNLLGLIQSETGDPVAAAKSFHRAAELDASEKNLFDLGDHLLRHGGVEDAGKTFAFAIERHPKSPRLRAGLGIALYSLGHYDQAVQSLCEAVDLDPKDSRPLHFLGKMYDVSPAASEQVRLRLADFVAKYPDNAFANYYYALSLWKRHERTNDTAELNRVEWLLKKAAAANPDFSDAHLQLAVLYEETGRDGLAIDAYNRALNGDANIEKAHYRLGQLFQRSGQQELARKHLAAYRALREKQKGTGSRP